MSARLQSTPTTAPSQNGRHAFARGMRLLVGAAPATAVGYLASIVMSGLLPVAQVWLLQQTMNALSARATDVIVAYALAYAVSFLLLLGLAPLEDALISRLQRRSAAAIDLRLITAGTALVDLAALESPTFQDDLSLLRARAYGLFWTFRALRNGVVTALVLGGLLLLLGQLSPLLPLLLALAAIPHVWAERHVAKVKYEAVVERSRTLREMDYCAQIMTEPASAKEVRVFGLGDFFLQRFRARAALGLAEITRARLKQLWLSLATSILYILALAGGFWYVATQAAAGRLALGAIALYLGAVAQAQARLSILALVVGWTYDFQHQLRGLFTFLDSARPRIALVRGASLPEPAVDSATQVEARNLTFTYATGTSPVLVSLAATLPAGKITAVVGANGAGKTTLVKLLLRMYDPSSGALLLDDALLAEYDLAALRGRIAVVNQDFARFALTLGENIAVGAVALKSPPREIAQAAHMAGADAVAASLPQGYATPLTRRFAGGVELSGGQWQRVALARAFLRDAALLVLDEPTAALDAEAEAHLFGRVRALAAGKTALVISHRLSTARQADQILVLEDGAIVEAGAHADLLAAGGRYATLYEMQAARYR